jgi:hypothetical protein
MTGEPDKLSKSQAVRNSAPGSHPFFMVHGIALKSTRFFRRKPKPVSPIPFPALAVPAVAARFASSQEQP